MVRCWVSSSSSLSSFTSWNSRVQVFFTLFHTACVDWYIVSLRSKGSREIGEIEKFGSIHCIEHWEIRVIIEHWELRDWVTWVEEFTWNLANYYFQIHAALIEQFQIRNDTTLIGQFQIRTVSTDTEIDAPGLPQLPRPPFCQKFKMIPINIPEGKIIIPAIKF
jgi:hypothetical protein